MIVTVFGDVHGNLPALEKLFAIETSATDLFVCHGDLVNYGPWSNECVDFLETKNNCIKLKGNHEQYFIKGHYDGINLVAQSFFNFCYKKFSHSSQKVIQKYGANFETDEFIINHTIFEKYIFMDTNLSENMIYKNQIIGHSHQQYQRECSGFKIYNTGSLGQNRLHINQSNYLQIDTDKNLFVLKSFTHDIDSVINKMKSEKYPDLCINYYLSKKRI